MTKVFVSGCYDIIHAGHCEFFQMARVLGDSLTVCYASDEVYRLWKGREPAMPEDCRRAILEELRCVDAAVVGARHCRLPYLDFAEQLLEIGADVLASTYDDRYAEEKRDWCRYHGVQFVQLPKLSRFTRISTTEIRERLAEAAR